MRKLKQALSLSLALVLSLGLTFSVTPTVHAATYEYAVEGGNLKFDPTTGTITDCDSSVYSADIPSEIYGVPVTAIGKSAFSSCKKLSSVTIPSTVTTIGPYAFDYCNNLTSITIPNSVTELEGSNNGGATFRSCSSLESITIPGSIKIIPSYAFSGCTKLKEVIFQEGVEKIEKNAFGTSYARNKSMKEITLPDSLKEISNLAFYYCEALEKVTFGTGLRRIDNNAFYNCKNLYAMYFTGDAPSATDKMVYKFADGFKIYYPEGSKGWTTPTWNGYITEAYTLPDTKPTTPQTPEKPTQPEKPTIPAQPQQPARSETASPTNDKLMVDGVVQNPTVYKIGGYNYFKIRDLAAVLNGTGKQFAVGYDAATSSVTATTGQGYTKQATDLLGAPSGTATADVSNDTILVNGQTAQVEVYKIDGMNYFKLRDLGSALGFQVGWDAAKNVASIDTRG